MITLKAINKKYNKNVIFNQFDMQVESGVLTAIKGRIGTGKSTLLNIIAGLDSSYTGTCSIFGNIQPKNDRLLASYRLRHIGYIPQDYQLLEDLTCFDNVALPLKFLKETESARESKVRDIMEELQITHLRDKYPSEISGGQRQLISISRALVKKPSIIIGDEITGALDRITEEEVLTSLKYRQSKDSCIIIATHSQAVAEKCQRVIELDK